ncbi:MAG TPA: sigma-54 dependent transcriptional regulator [Polyangiaceae bacterium]
MKECILVIDDDSTIRNNVVELLVEEGFEAIAADNGRDGIALAKARVPAVVVSDVTMPGVDGYEVLQALRQHASTTHIPLIFLSARAERSEVRTGMNLGADDYLTKPFALSELLESVRSRLKRVEELGARGRRALEIESRRTPRPGPTAFSSAEGVVVVDPVMRELHAQAFRAAGSSINVLILGENGVGKEILARAVHNLSPRRAGPFLALNCAALTESLVEAELFGHEKGAFTGALQARAGLLESASGGTVFLDEVGELPPSIQTKLLRVLEERRVLRVGGRAPTAVDVRFVAATNLDLESECARGTFREDLYYRLNGIAFTVPPLRERPTEIEPLARMFLARSGAENRRSRPLDLAPETLELLRAYPWPGNVRELRNALERGDVLADGDRLLPEHLPPKVLQGARPTSRPPSADGDDARAAALRELAEVERRRIHSALEQCGGNQTRAAELLGISRRTLVYRLTDLGMPRPRKRES